MPFSFLPATLSAWFSLIVGVLDRRSAPRPWLLLCGAVWPAAEGPIWVVNVREEDGWLAFFCTDPAVSAGASWRQWRTGGRLSRR